VSRGAWAAIAVLAAALVLGVVVLARQQEALPHRCGAGFVALGTRCCGQGQTLSGDACVGMPTACGPDHDATSVGCAPKHTKIAIVGGTLTLGPSDWEAQGVVAPRTITVNGFEIDRFEIDRASYAACARAHRCPEMTIDDDPFSASAGQADAYRAARLTLEQARAYCRDRGGRLPTDDEWTFAAMGRTGRRYPWGDTGAVCDRAVFGLVTGPCARGAKTPDTVGTRSRGASAEGLFDLAGNVAEWTESPSGPRLRGGSYASSLATDLRGWRAETASTASGARCAYELPRP
jgi:formylglycine-generating enzyme required for sulfatase activity